MPRRVPAPTSRLCTHARLCTLASYDLPCLTRCTLQVESAKAEYDSQVETTHAQISDRVGIGHTGISVDISHTGSSVT